MAFSLNRVTLIGNVGKDPEIRTTQDGKEVATFSIATSESWRDKNSGEKKERTEWHRVVIFSQHLINVVKNYVHKGSKLFVEGSIHTRKWNDQAGTEKQTTEIVIQSYSGNLMMLDGKNTPNMPLDQNFQRDPSHIEEKNRQDFAETIDDDIPF
jgi:single-strand DNA-binding protein